MFEMSKRTTLKFSGNKERLYYSKWDYYENILDAEIEVVRVEDHMVYPYERYGYNIILHYYNCPYNIKQKHILETRTAHTYSEARVVATILWCSIVGKPDYLK